MEKVIYFWCFFMIAGSTFIMYTGIEAMQHMHTTDEEIRKKIKLKFFASKIIFCLMVVPILLFIIAMETKIFN
jgi:hypothetical protein